MANDHGKRISKDEFEKMKHTYEDAEAFATQSVYFDLPTFQRLLDVPGVAGVRVYYGVNEKEELHPMFVPVDAFGKNIWDDKGVSTIEEYGNPCPPFCNGGE